MKTTTQRRKRAITLIEMIVVMLLIAMITGALAYNYNSSLNEGKAFKTKEAITRIKTIIALALAENPDVTESDVLSRWKEYVHSSPLAGKSDDLIRDGWGQEFDVGIGTGDNGAQEIQVSSRRYEAYLQQKRAK